MVRFLARTARKYNVPVIVAGDIFHHWKPTPFLLQWCIRNLPPIITVWGQHDLPQHSLNLRSKSGLSVLEAAGVVKPLAGGSKDRVSSPAVVYGYSYGDTPSNPLGRGSAIRVAVCHMMCWHKKLPYPGCEADNAIKVLKKLDGYDLILTGDNHKPFVVSYKGRLLVNPGSLMRMTADQAKHKPRVYLWYAKTNTVKKVYLPIEEGVVSREHIEKVNKKDERMEAFIERVNDSYEASLSFEENMKRFLKKNKVSKRVKSIIHEVME